MQNINKLIVVLGLSVALVFGMWYTHPDLTPVMTIVQQHSWQAPRQIRYIVVPNNSDVDVSSGWRDRFAIDLLSGLGNSAPTQNTVDFIVSWTLAEDSGDDAYLRHNPLNTTQQGFDETHSINSDGVRGYASYEAGLSATVQTLSYGYYTEIVDGLQTNDPQRAFNGLISSPWASSHYNGGQGWPQVRK